MESQRPKREKNSSSRWKKIVLAIFLDVVLLAAFLLTFAYFHHVKPGKPVEAIVIERPDTTPAPQAATPEPVESETDTETELEATPEPTPAPLTWKDIFADKFTDGEIIQTETSFASPNTYIDITYHKTIVERAYGGKMYPYDVFYYVADIYITDVEQFATAFPKGEYVPAAYGGTLSQIRDANGVVGVNGDNCGSKIEGLIIRNGSLYRDTLFGNDVMVLYYDGTMVPYLAGEVNVAEIIAQGPYQAWEFGPALVKDGQIVNSPQVSDYVHADNPRTAIGYYEPGHYCMVVVEGREPTDSLGADINLLSQIMYELGCESAYNLDGGQTSAMVYNNEYVNIRAGGGRRSTDTILILDPDYVTEEN